MRHSRPPRKRSKQFSSIDGETEALTLIRSVIERHAGRLEELLAEHEEIEAEEADERHDRAALDCSPAFERHRRYQSARHRELMRTLEMLRKMRNAECGMGKKKRRMANVRCRMANVRCRMTDAGRGMTVASRRKRSARRRKMCKTKPIWNQRKLHYCLRLNRLRPSRLVKNEANSHR